MAKLAVLILAAFAFHAASAGVLLDEDFRDRTLRDTGYGLQDSTWNLRYYSYPTGKFDVLVGKLQTVAQDLITSFQRTLPNDRLVIKTLVWQSRELACYIDAIIERLQVETYNYKGQVGVILEKVVDELRDIQMHYYQIAAYTTDVYAFDQVKDKFCMTVKRTIVLLEKLVRLVQIDFDQTQGELHVIVQTVITDFLYVFQNICRHLQYYGVYGQQSPKQLGLQIQEVTDGLIGYLQGVTRFDGHRKFAIYEYVKQVGAIIRRMQEVEGSYGKTEIDDIFQHVFGKLRRVLVPFMQMMDTDKIQNVEVIRMELIKELKLVAEAFERFTLYGRTGEYQTFCFEMLGDYLYTIQHLRMQMQWGYLSYYGLYTSGFYGHTEFPGFFGKYGYQDKYGGRLGEIDYGSLGKFTKYGQFEIEIQTLIRGLYRIFQTVSFDDTITQRVCMRMICGYAYRLEFIVERLHQCVHYGAETDADAYMLQQTVQNLRQYVLGLKQCCFWEYSSKEMCTQCFMYIQKIATEFKRLIKGFEYTQGNFNNLVQELLIRYTIATECLCRMMENIREYSQYRFYGPYSPKFYDDRYGFDKYDDDLGRYGRGYGFGLDDQDWKGYGHGLGQILKGYGLGLGQDWKGYGIGRGQDWKSYGYGVGQMWKGYGTSLGQNWRGYGYGLGQDWKGYGTTLSQNWRGYGYGLGQDWKTYGIGRGQDWKGYGYGLDKYGKGYLPYGQYWKQFGNYAY